MSDVLTFWMDRGVEGFRVDAILHLFEDEELRDELKSNFPDILEDEYPSLLHIHTRDQEETYDVVAAWRCLMDEYSEKHNTDDKFLIVEADVPLEIMKKYFEVGSNPFNFMFVYGLNSSSRAGDFKTMIDNWINNLPEGNVSNWVTGNHDNHRSGSRFGAEKADMLAMLAMTLPGITVVYYGDEIGMVDENLSWEETIDVTGCNVGPEKYHLASRDPERTPFQWDD